MGTMLDYAPTAYHNSRHSAANNSEYETEAQRVKAERKSWRLRRKATGVRDNILTKQTARYSRPTYHSGALKDKAFIGVRQEAVLLAA
jgi:hypothetical protein